jgi:hypothetical protein
MKQFKLDRDSALGKEIYVLDDEVKGTRVRRSSATEWCCLANSRRRGGSARADLTKKLEEAEEEEKAFLAARCARALHAAVGIADHADSQRAARRRHQAAGAAARGGEEE